MQRRQSSRDDVAVAFVRGESARGSSAMFTDGETVWSYGKHYVLAEDRLDGSVGVNEHRESVTTSAHSAAVRRALEDHTMLRPTRETYQGANGHTYRIWR